MTAFRLGVFAVAVVLLTTLSAVARLGETFDECTARYGKHVRISDDGEVYVFESGSFRIFIEFHEGKADLIAYKRLAPTKDYVGKPIQMTTTEIHSLLDKNFGDSPWKTSHPDLYRVDYICEDKSMTATYSTLTGKLLVLTDKALQRVLAEFKQAADKDKDVEHPGLEGL